VVQLVRSHPLQLGYHGRGELAGVQEGRHESQGKLVRQLGRQGVVLVELGQLAEEFPGELDEMLDHLLDARIEKLQKRLEEAVAKVGVVVLYEGPGESACEGDDDLDQVLGHVLFVLHHPLDGLLIDLEAHLQHEAIDALVLTGAGDGVDHCEEALRGLLHVLPLPQQVDDFAEEGGVRETVEDVRVVTDAEPLCEGLHHWPLADAWHLPHRLARPIQQTDHVTLLAGQDSLCILAVAVLQHNLFVVHSAGAVLQDLEVVLTQLWILGKTLKISLERVAVVAQGVEVD
jgi:hypothetical protein